MSQKVARLQAIAEYVENDRHVTMYNLARINNGRKKPDETGRITSAANSFFLSMLYLALMFVVLVSASFGFSGAALGAGKSIVAVGKIEWSSGS